jgi:hypothetical protein
MKQRGWQQTAVSMASRQLVSIALTGLAILTMSGEASPAPDRDSAAHLAPTVAVQQAIPQYQRLRDEAAMVLVGSALMGLAAAVRRAA